MLRRKTGPYSTKNYSTSTYRECLISKSTFFFKTGRKAKEYLQNENKITLNVPTVIPLLMAGREEKREVSPTFQPSTPDREQVWEGYETGSITRTESTKSTKSTKRKKQTLNEKNPLNTLTKKKRIPVSQSSLPTRG